VQKVALITGTGSGIGKAFAELLLSKDYIVYGYSRTNYIQHANFIFTAIDLSNLESVKELQFPKCKSEDILLVNNAATIGEAMPLHLKKDATIINDYNLNIIAPTLLCSKFMNSYADTQKLIINIGSGAANNAIASWNTYCPTKSALDMLTRVIAAEKHEKLNIYSVHPGVVDTNMQEKIRASDAKLFPLLDKFTAYHNNNELETTTIAAQKLLYIIQNFSEFTKNILSIRDVNLN
jgi:benzil reductase ((S)-benzoin forming)